MSGGSKSHPISIKSQIDAIQRYKAEIKRLRNALETIGRIGANPITEYDFGPPSVGMIRLADKVWEITRETLNSKTKIHFHSTANELYYRAAQKVIPCLEDWIKTTGFGEVNKRDREALELLQKAVERSKEEYDAVNNVG